MHDTDHIREGVAYCRQGRWREGLHHLAQVAGVRNRQTKLPAEYFSFYGYGIALLENRYREGVSLCERAIKVGFYEPQHYFHLASVQMMRGNRRAAVRVIDKGLNIEPAYQPLHKLLNEIGQRRRPVVPFLSRNNSINVALGRLRHKLLEKPGEARI